MKNQLLTIDRKKRQITSNLKKLRNKYIASIYDGVIKRKPIKEIHQDIQKITTIANNQGLIYTRNMQNFVLKLADRTKKDVDIAFYVNGKLKGDFGSVGMLEIAIADLIFEKLDKRKVFQKTNTVAYDVSKKYEADFKDEIIKLEIKRNRHYIIPRVFYLASSHNDCALDHLNYQGKIYIDEKWKTIIKDDELRKKVANYVSQNNVKTFQWVIGKPVWLITRPNCRHYVKSLDTLDVMGHSIAELTRNHKLHTVEGKKLTKTIWHPLDKKWYKEANIKDIIKKYEERLEYHKSLWDVKKSQPVKRAMEKDRLLIQKWKDYLNQMKGD